MLNIPEVICISQTADTDRFFNGINFSSVLSYLKKLLVALPTRDLILPKKLTLFWNSNDILISRKLVKLRLLDPALDDPKGTITPTQYSMNKQTVSIECSL